MTQESSVSAVLAALFGLQWCPWRANDRTPSRTATEPGVRWSTVILDDTPVRDVISRRLPMRSRTHG